MAKDYVEKRDTGHFITGTRVSLDSVIYAFLRGSSPESIAGSFPVLHLEEVYGAIAYYLANQDELDAHFLAEDRQFQLLQQAARQANPLLHKKLVEARQTSVR